MRFIGNLLNRFFRLVMGVGKAEANNTPQTDVLFAFIYADTLFASTPGAVEMTILHCPDNAGFQLEFIALSMCSHTVPADSNGTILADLEFVDDSDGDAVSNIKAAIDFEGQTARVSNPLWRGSQILDPGDSVNLEMATDGAISTPSVGALLCVEYKIVERMAA